MKIEKYYNKNLSFKKFTFIKNIDKYENVVFKVKNVLF